MSEAPPPGTVTRTIAEFAGGLRLADVPADVVRFTKSILLDCVGCMIAGRTGSLGRIALEFARTVSRQDEAQLVGGPRVAVERAAFANTVLCNALDYEPVGPEGHVGAVAVPATLALADWRESSGEEFLVALIAAIEASGRVGAALRRVSVQASAGGLPQVRGTPHAIFAATVPAARLLGLDVEQTRNALGIAAYAANLPTLRKAMDAVEMPMTKYDHLGTMASEGIDAARLAALGFTGDREVFEGDYGFWRFSGALGCEWPIMLGYGDGWVIPETFYKPYPCILYVTPGIEAVLAIVREHGLRPEEIRGIEIGASRMNRGQLLTDLRGPLAAWMSYRLNVANAVYDVRPRRAWQDEAAFTPALRELASRIEIRPLSERGGASPRAAYWEGHAPAEAVVRTEGATYEHRVAGLPRLSDEQLREKFFDNARGLLEDAAARRVVAAIEDLEHLASVRPLVAALA